MSRRQLLRQAADLAASYLEGVDDRIIQPQLTLSELLAGLGGPVPLTGTNEHEVLEQLARAADLGLLATSSPRFFGWVIGGTEPIGIAADLLTSAWDQNAGSYAVSPAAAVVEEVTGEWLKELLGLPQAASYAFVTGCQMAHVTALAAARYRLLQRADWDLSTKGLFGGPGIRVLTGQHRHETFVRALRLLGIGSDSIEVLNLDDKGRLDSAALEAAMAPEQPTLVCLQAGDLNTGQFDDFETLCTIAHRHPNAWVHVDGAFGLWAAVSDAHRHLLRGVERANSWATDGHKWLNVPYDCGYAFVADAEAHRASAAMEASYLIANDETGRDAIDWTPEWSRRARAFPTYAVIRALGRAGIARMVERCCQVAVQLVGALGQVPGIEVLHTPTINQGLVRFTAADGDHDAFTDRVCEAIQQEGTTWFGPVTWRGQRAMRISVCNHRTSEADVRPTVDAVVRAMKRASE